MITATTDERDIVDLRVLFANLWAARWWIVLSVIAVTALFVLIAIKLPPVYRTAAVLVSTSGERSSLSGSLGAALGQLGGLAGLAGINLGSADATTEEALAVLKSRQFTEKFIADFNLLPKFFPDDWDAAAGKWKVPPDKQPTLADGSKYFGAEIRNVTQDTKTRLVTLRIQWRDPVEAAQWANELVRRLNAEMRRRAIEKSMASMAFLEKELIGTEVVGTREAINRLIETQMRERMLANVTVEYAFRTVDAALPPDPDDYVRATKLLLVLLGPIVGFLLGFAAARIAAARARRKLSSAA